MHRGMGGLIHSCVDVPEVQPGCRSLQDEHTHSYVYTHVVVSF